MTLQDLIPADEFCTHHGIEYAFIHALHEQHLVEVVTVQERAFIQAETLHQLEKYVRLHYDMEINIQGIEAIDHLLNRVAQMQHEMAMLKTKLRLYEDSAADDAAI